MAHHFILLRLNPFDLRVDREGWWFEHSVSQLWVYLSADSAKSVSLLWLSPLQGWGSLTMAFTGKFVYMAHHFILLRLNPFDLRVDREGWWFEHSVSQLWVCLSAEDAKNVFWPWLSPLQRWGSLTMAFTGKFVYDSPFHLGAGGRVAPFFATICFFCDHFDELRTVLMKATLIINNASLTYL